MPHHCHARGFVVPVKPELLMCLRHWRMVPRAVQRAVWATYRPGQCDDKGPSDAWHQAADAAIGYVAHLEHLGIRRVEAEAVKVLGVADRGILDWLASAERP